MYTVKEINKINSEHLVASKEIADTLLEKHHCLMDYAVEIDLQTREFEIDYRLSNWFDECVIKINVEPHLITLWVNDKEFYSPVVLSVLESRIAQELNRLFFNKKF